MVSQLESDTTKLLYNLGKDTYGEQATLQTFLKVLTTEARQWRTIANAVLELPALGAARY